MFMVSIFTNLQGEKALLDKQARDSAANAAKEYAAGNVSKGQQQSDAAAKANVASAQLSKQIAETGQ